jgi:sugar phosphate isomerase/epimerase
MGISIYSISRKITRGEITPEQAVEWLAKEAGAEIIEIVPFGIDIINNKDLAVTLKKIAEDNGSAITNYSLNANFLQISNAEYTAEIERVKTHMDSAVKLGIETMRVDSSSYRRKPEDNTIANYIDDLPLIAETYVKLCDYAKQYNITVLLENHGFHVNGSDRIGAVLSLLEKIKCANFSYQLDAGNFLCVDENPEVAAKRLAGKAMTVHMKDFYVRDESSDPGDATQFDCSGSWFRSQHNAYLRGSILGQGDMNMKKIAGIIKESGFDGCAYLEYEGMEDCYYGTKVGFENMKKLLG